MTANRGMISTGYLFCLLLSLVLFVASFGSVPDEFSFHDPAHNSVTVEAAGDYVAVYGSTMGTLATSTEWLRNMWVDESTGSAYVDNYVNVYKITSGGSLSYFYTIPDSNGVIGMCGDSANSVLYLVLGDGQTFVSVSTASSTGSLIASYGSFQGSHSCASNNAGTVYIMETWNGLVVYKTDKYLTNPRTTKVVDSSSYNGDFMVYSSYHNKLFITPSSNYYVYQVDLSSTSYPLTVTNYAGYADNWNDYETGNEGPATSALLRRDAMLAADTVGNIFFASSDAQTVRVIDANSIIHQFAGSASTTSTDDGTPALNARIERLRGIGANDGLLYLLDYNQQKVRTISYISDINGHPPSYSPTAAIVGAPTALGCTVSSMTVTGLSFMNGIYIDESGNKYFTSSYNIYKVTPAGVQTTLYTTSGTAMNQVCGGTGTGVMYATHSDFSTVSSFSLTTGSKIATSGAYTGSYGLKSCAADTAGYVYIIDSNWDKVAWVYKTNKYFDNYMSNKVVTISGYRLQSIYLSSTNQMFLAEEEGRYIWKLDHSASNPSYPLAYSVYAGNGDGSTPTETANYGTAITTKFSPYPYLTGDTLGNLFVSASYTYNVRVITPSGIVYPFLGIYGFHKYTADGSSALTTPLYSNYAALANNGVFYVGDNTEDYSTQYIRMVQYVSGSAQCPVPSAAPTTATPFIAPSRTPTQIPSQLPTVLPTRPTLIPTLVPTQPPTVQPSFCPTAYPTSRPSDQPSTQPSGRPSVRPSRQPTSHPTAQPMSHPSARPSAQPSSRPSCLPTSRPSRQPSGQPVSRPSSQPSRQPTSHPSTVPSGHPSSQPSLQPSGHPTTHPSRLPSSQPTRHPSTRPSSRPSTQPSEQPTVQPSGRPTDQPSVQPSSRPSTHPSGVPSSQPTRHPSTRPSARPSTQPSEQPTAQPSERPTDQPSVQPSSRPSTHPSCVPSSQPTSRPSRQPSSRPSSQPSCRPSSHPSTQPSVQPSSQPSRQPTVQPSSQPSTQPSARPSAQPVSRPSAQPSTQPSSRPSVRPTSQPTVQPSDQPSNQPTGQPTDQPTKQPSTQPASVPTSHPTVQPTTFPSSHPSMQPSELPSSQPSNQPSNAPTGEPSGQPSTQPTGFPSGQPSMQPSSQPTDLPTSVPSAQPSLQPVSEPSSQPTDVPSAVPSVQPSDRPTSQPSGQPQAVPSALPSLQPSGLPSTQPTTQPSMQPSTQPSTQPTSRPTGHAIKKFLITFNAGVQVTLIDSVRRRLTTGGAVLSEVDLEVVTDAIADVLSLEENQIVFLSQSPVSDVVVQVNVQVSSATDDFTITLGHTAKYLFDWLSSTWTSAVGSGLFTQAIQTHAASLNSTTLMHAVSDDVSTLTVSDYTEVNTDDSKDNNLSSGALGGIVVGAVLVFSLIVFVVCWMRRNPNAPSKRKVYVVEVQPKNETVVNGQSAVSDGVKHEELPADSLV